MEKTKIEMYIASIYYVLSTLSTIGYGDITVFIITYNFMYLLANQHTREDFFHFLYVRWCLLLLFFYWYPLKYFVVLSY